MISLLIILVLAFGVLTSPINDETSTEQLHVEGRDVPITIDELDNLRLYAQWAGVSYCNPVAGKLVYCKNDICPTGGNNATVHSVFHGIETDILGLLAVDSTRHEIVISIRGSSSLANWLTDVVWAREPTAMCEGCWAHLGFLLAYSEIIHRVNNSLAAATRLFPSYGITVTGHSLGAAVATLVAMRLREVGYQVDLYTYGSPRVGNLALVSYLTTGPSSSSFSSSVGSTTTPKTGNTNSVQNGPADGSGKESAPAPAFAPRNYRVTHFADVVPRLPPLNREFRHTSPEYWLSSGPSRRVGYTSTQVRRCAGYASIGCNAGEPWWEVDITSHLYYFVAISHCGEDTPRLSFGVGNDSGTSWFDGEKEDDNDDNDDGVITNEPVNGTTATNISIAGLDPAAANTLAMYANLDQQYAGALQDSEVDLEPVF